MKKLLFILVSLFVIGLTVSASNSTTGTSSQTTYSPQVCQFSLSSYSGTINYSGNTEKFTVGLSCPQESDIYATVGVIIDGDLVATTVVKVKAGETRSTAQTISVGGKYAGKSYRLVVE